MSALIDFIVKSELFIAFTCRLFICCRAHRADIENHSSENELQSSKMHQTSRFAHGESFTGLRDVPAIFRQLLHVFHLRFGKRCLQNALSSLVRLKGQISYAKTIFMVFFSLGHRLPFDWQNPLGYLVAFSFQFTVTWYLLLTILCTSIFAIGTCLTLLSLAEDIKCELHAIKLSATFGKNRLEMLQRFKRFVEFHSFVKQLSVR